MNTMKQVRFQRVLLLAALPALWLVGCGDGDPSDLVNADPSIELGSTAPAFAEQWYGPLEVTVTGSGFQEGATVLLDGESRETAWQSSTRLQATLTPADIEVERTASLAVRNPGGSGAASEPLAFDIRAPSDSFPVMTSMTPDHTVRGSGNVTVTIEGRGFFPGAQVLLRGIEKPTIRYSAMRMEAQLDSASLTEPGVHPVHVINPTPRGHAAREVFTVLNPVPTIDSVSPGTVAAGQAGPTLSVVGTGFFRGSTFSTPTVVHVNGEERQTTWVSHSRLDVDLTAADVASPDTLVVRVVNSEPGGGSSAPDSVYVVASAPLLEALPVQGGRAGGSGLDLMVHGQFFTPDSEVLWDGTPQVTQYLTGMRLRATILSDDVAAPGEVAVSVRTPGVGASDTRTFTVRDLAPSAVTALDTVPVRGRDLVFDPGTAALYVSVPAGAPSWANTVAVIDPFAATVVTGIAVGSDPGRLARTDDGQYLYVGLDGAGAVRRVSLPSGTPGLQWWLPSGQVAGDLETAPGQPETVAVSRHQFAYSPSLAGVTIYDDGVARPVSSPGHTGGARIEFLDTPTRLYGYNNAHTGFEFFTMRVADDGVSHLYEDGGLIDGFSNDILGIGGRIYAIGGEVVDVELRTRLGALPTSGSRGLAVDPLTGRAFGRSDQGIAVFDLNTFELVGTIPVVVTGVTRMVRWADDGLAILTADEVILVRSPIIAP